MRRKYDPIVKVIVGTSPGDWPLLDGRAAAPVTDISSEVTAAVSASADCFLRVDAPEPYVFHVDFQSGHDSAQLPPRLDLYNTVVGYRTGLPVRSVAVILRPEADSPQLTGLFRRRLPGERRSYKLFRYGVLRVWEQPPERFLTLGSGTVPLAAISAVSEAGLPRMIQQMERRLRDEPASPELWEATRVLLGLRYPADMVQALLRRIREMKESTTYQATLAEGREQGLEQGLEQGREEGRVEEARKMLLLYGEHAYGPADKAIRRALQDLNDAERLEELARRMPHTPTWQELLGLPAARRSSRRRST